MDFRKDMELKRLEGEMRLKGRPFMISSKGSMRLCTVTRALVRGVSLLVAQNLGGGILITVRLMDLRKYIARQLNWEEGQGESDFIQNKTFHK